MYVFQSLLRCCLFWGLSYKKWQAVYNSAYAFTSYLGQSSRLAIGEKLRLVQVLGMCTACTCACSSVFPGVCLSFSKSSIGSHSSALSYTFWGVSLLSSPDAFTPSGKCDFKQLLLIVFGKHAEDELFAYSKLWVKSNDDKIWEWSFLQGIAR